MATPPIPESEDPFGPDLGAYEDTAARIRELNDRLIDASKAAGRVVLDAYEQTLRNFLDFEEHIAGATRLEWVSALSQTHAALVRDVTAAYLRLARELLT